MQQCGGSTAATAAAAAAVTSGTASDEELPQRHLHAAVAFEWHQQVAPVGLEKHICKVQPPVLAALHSRKRGGSALEDLGPQRCRR